MFFPILQDWRSEPPGSPHPRLCESPKRCAPSTCPHPSTCFQGHPSAAGLPACWLLRESGSAQRPAEVALHHRSTAGPGCCFPPSSLDTSKPLRSLQILSGGCNSSAHCGQAPSQLETTGGQALGVPTPRPFLPRLPLNGAWAQAVHPCGAWTSVLV